MDDYAELVKKLRSFAICEDSDYENGGCAGYDVIMQAADAIEKLVLKLDKANNDGFKTSNWIPVTEWLPEDPGDYLVYVVGGEWRQLSWIDIDYFNGEKFRGGKWTTANPVAWMPLPEPPKEET